ncbi:MAG: hypothetical protein WCO26_11085 [Deltaproteobacteria bacterium]
MYLYPAPRAPKYVQPRSVEECLPQARFMAKKTLSRAALGPVTQGDKILIVTYFDQDNYVKTAIAQALKEEGAKAVDFVTEHELAGKKPQLRSVEDGWVEADRMIKALPEVAKFPLIMELGDVTEAGEALPVYLDEHPEYTGVFWGLGGRVQLRHALGRHGHKFRNNWVFNNWEELVSKAWLYPDELLRETERLVLETIGKASEIRITDPEGTHLEYRVKEEEALRWQMGAWESGHLFLDPLQATSQECSKVPVSPTVPPVFHDLNGVLAGTANHFGFFPRIELCFEHGLLVDVKGGGKYGQLIKGMMEQYKDIQWPGYPRRGFFWFCDSALCMLVKAFRRTSDPFSSYWITPNIPERNRAGVFHHGFGSRRHFGEEFDRYIKEHNLPHTHIHVHNYFTTYEVKLRTTGQWVKIADKGWLTVLDDPRVRALAVRFGDPDELLSYDWVPPVPGINVEGNYLSDYAPEPVRYLKMRIAENKSI